jgi:hypothetical protein
LNSGPLVPGTMNVVLALLLGVTVALGTSCGGGGGTSDASGNEAKRTIEANAQERAESINLVLADFPEGWRVSLAERDKAAQERLRRCVGSDYSGATIIGEADSKEFAHEDTTEASSSATVFESAEQATSDLVSPFDSELRNELLQTLAGRLSASPADE